MSSSDTIPISEQIEEAAEYVCHHCGKPVRPESLLDPFRYHWAFGLLGRGYLFHRFRIRKVLRRADHKTALALHDPAMRDCIHRPAMLERILASIGLLWPTLRAWWHRRCHPVAIHCGECANARHGHGVHLHFPLISRPPEQPDNVSTSQPDTENDAQNDH